MSFAPRRRSAARRHRVLALLGVSALLPAVLPGAACAQVQSLPAASAAQFDTQAGALNGASAGSLWGQARENTPVKIDVVSASEVRVGQEWSVELEVTNSSAQPITDLQITTRRGDTLADAAEVISALATGAYPYFATTASPQDLGPGESTRVSLKVPTALDAGTTPAGEMRKTLAIDTPGAYPVMFALTGVVDGEATALADERLALTVDPAEGNERPPQGYRPRELSVIYPLSAPLDIVPGETGGEALILESENLAQQMAPGGRLDALVDIYNDTNLSGAACVAVDPALIDTAERMAAGYTVNATRPPLVAQQKRLRDSWFQDDSTSRGKPGTGSAAAAAWLKKLSTVDCAIALPWANADINAVATTNNAWLMHEAIERGEETLPAHIEAAQASPFIIPSNGYVDQALPRPALVADTASTASTAAAGGRTAVFNADLATVLAATGEHPETTAYSDPALRYDYRMDSTASRARSAEAALAVAASASAAPAEATEPDNANQAGSAARANAAPQATVAKLPALLEPEAAAAVMHRARQLLDSGQATPKPVRDIPVRDAAGTAAGEAATQLGTPASQDPARWQDQQIVRMTQQAHYTDELTLMMVNDPAIAMTRYGFTLPLRRDILTALSHNGRRSQELAESTQDAAIARMDGNAEQLKQLRAGVSLIPPGNIYTRASASSPLLIVAENALPLPVIAGVHYEGPAGAVLHTPESIRIPAKGSITLSMTADLPKDHERSDLRLWMATPEGATISAPVVIGVQTRGGMLGIYGVSAVALLLASVAFIGRRMLHAR